MDIYIKKFTEDSDADSSHGAAVYETISAALEVGQKVGISFVGLKDCSDYFLEASIGRLYRNYDVEMLDRSIYFDYGHMASLLPGRIAASRDAAIQLRRIAADRRRL